MKPSDLESHIHRKLAELPAPKAPGTLLPRIMAEARRTRRSPWGQWSWIGGVRQRPAVRLVAWIALILMGVLALDWGSGGVVGSTWGVFLTTADEAAGGARAILHGGQILWRVLLEPIAVYLILWVGCMWVFLALLLEALKSVLWEGSIRQ